MILYATSNGDSEMIDNAGAAPAAAEPMTMDENTPDDAAPAAAGHAQTPTRSAIDRAFAEIEKREDSEAGEKRGEEREKPDAGKAQSRMPATDGPPISEPPQRFSADARAAWASVPDQVKGEVH